MSSDTSTRHALLNPDGVPINLQRQSADVTALYSLVERAALNAFHTEPTAILQSRSLAFALASHYNGTPTAVINDDGSEYANTLLDALVGSRALTDHSEYEAAIDSANKLTRDKRTHLSRYSSLLHLNALKHVSATRDWIQATYYRNPLQILMLATLLVATKVHMGDKRKQRVELAPLQLMSRAGSVVAPTPDCFHTAAQEYSKSAALTMVNPWNRGEHPDLINGLLETVARGDALPDLGTPHGRIPRGLLPRISQLVLGSHGVHAKLVADWDSTASDESVMVYYTGHLDKDLADSVRNAATLSERYMLTLKTHKGTPAVIILGDEGRIRSMATFFGLIEYT